VNGKKLRRQSIRVETEDVIKIGTFRLEIAEKSLGSATRGARARADCRLRGLPRGGVPSDDRLGLYEFASKARSSTRKNSSPSAEDAACPVRRPLHPPERSGKKVVRTWDKASLPQLAVSISRTVIERCLRQRVRVAVNRDGEARRTQTRAVGGRLPTRPCACRSSAGTASSARSTSTASPRP
jgi:hypothetical protein